MRGGRQEVRGAGYNGTDNLKPGPVWWSDEEEDEGGTRRERLGERGLGAIPHRFGSNSEPSSSDRDRDSEPWAARYAEELRAHFKGKSGGGEAGRRQEGKEGQKRRKGAEEGRALRAQRQSMSVEQVD